MSGKVRYSGDEGIPMLLSKAPSYIGWCWVKGRLVEAADAFSPPKHT